MRRVAEKIVNLVFLGNSMDEDEKAAVSFGLWVILDTGIKYLCILLCVTILLDFFSACMLAVEFALLRLTGGGYHAKTSFMCGFWMVLITVLSALLQYIISFSALQVLMIGIVVVGALSFWTIDGSEHPTRFAVKNNKWLFLLLILFYTGIAIIWKNTRTSIMMIIVLDSILVMISKKKNIFKNY